MTSNGHTSEFNLYVETREIFRQIDKLTWEYIASHGSSGEKRAERVQEYGNGLKNAISAYIDTRTEMVSKLLIDPRFMNTSIPAANSPTTESSPADQALWLYSTLSELSASESPQEQGVLSE